MAANLNGMQVVDSREQKVFGRVTHTFEEGSRLYALLNDDFEVCLEGYDYIIDLTGIARAKNPQLEAAYVRLHPAC